VDDIEYQKQAAVAEAKNARIAKLASKYEASTGQPIEDKVKAKLASLDQETLDQLLKVANNNSNGHLESLGGPGDIADDSEPLTKKEAATKADDSFLNWVLS
jgi:hypothetical protein